MGGVIGEGCKGGGAGHLLPRFVIIIERDEVNAEVLFVPRCQCLWIVAAEEKAADALHAFLFLRRVG